ncbi:MAG: 3-dehydroquinate synthase [Ignavibacteriae bacterium]|nr:3-dehydroquinate synthase [Ignavibacteriota bacterium]
MKKISVKIPDKEYNVFLGSNSFVQLPKLLKKENLTNNLLLVIDKNVHRYYSQIIDGTFSRIKHKRIVLTSTEKNKNFETLNKIHSLLIKNNFGRDAIIIAIGGGIIGDVTGFAAATFMRGIKYVQVPTTLLASVDSSVGGKTGINFNSTKNIIGSFHQPELVVIDTEFFKTLPEEELLCGIGEIIKYCFLTDEQFFNYVKKNIQNLLLLKPSSIQHVITKSIKFKGNVVSADEKESGIRKILNLGHTFAHAFEVEQNHKLKHGQAVIVGITCSLYLSKELGIVSEDDFRKYLDFLLLFADKIKLRKVNITRIYNIMKKDKKNRSNEIRFVLANKIGNTFTDVPASKKTVITSITKGISHF